MMKKSSLILFLLFAVIMLGGKRAKADIEAIQPVFGQIHSTIKEATLIKEELGELQEEMRSQMEGLAGPIKSAVSTVKNVADQAKAAASQVKSMANDPTGTALSAADGSLSLPTLNLTLPSFMNDVDDQEKTSKAITSHYMFQKGAKKNGKVDTNEAMQLQNEKLMVIQRDNFAKLYATAFTIRTNMAKERLAEKKDVLADCSKESDGNTSGRCVKAALKEKASTTAKRMGRILNLELAIFDLAITQQAGIYQKQVDDDEE